MAKAVTEDEIKTYYDQNQRLFSGAQIHAAHILVKDEQGADKIGFEFVEGPVTPKPEKLPGARKRSAPRKPKGGEGPKGPTKPLMKV